MLAGMDKCLAVAQAVRQRPVHRRNLHEVGPRTDHVKNIHGCLVVSSSNQLKIRDDCSSCCSCIRQRRLGAHRSGKYALRPRRQERHFIVAIGVVVGQSTAATTLLFAGAGWQQIF